MREIKLRAISLTNGEWVYGSILKIEDEFYVYPNTFGLKSENFWNDIIPVDSETVGQFTGLHDKNGREIYEGDIRGGFYFCMEDKIEFLEVIKCHLSPHVGYCYYWESAKGGGMPDFMETEIIGNIHENPELLEAGK